ncbi:hypothetical protein ACFL09_07110 [Planctomycetota bacterium]
MQKAGSNPDKFLVTVPLWCRGTDLQGNRVRLRRSLRIIVTAKEVGDGFGVESFEFRDGPLTLARQILIWMALAFVWTIVIGVYFMVKFTKSKPTETDRALTWIGGLVPMAYFSYICFGAVWAARTDSPIAVRRETTGGEASFW